MPARIRGGALPAGLGASFPLRLQVVEANREKEAQAKDTIQQLKLEIANLTRLVEQGAGLNLGPEETVRQAAARRERGRRKRGAG